MSGARILAIDTVTEGCSAALRVGEEIIQRFEVTPRGHTQRILPMVDALLAEAGCSLRQLDAIAFDRGPGSFTGLRITAGVVQGLAYAAERPVIPISSLAALASAGYRAHGCRQLLSAIDARMQELYWGVYTISETGVPQLQGEEQLLSPHAVPAVEGQWCGVGSGWSGYAELLQESYRDQLQRIDGKALPQAQEIARLALDELQAGNLLPAEQAQPLYLRNQVVHRS
jgi:tRNA threonylcarbamoyladenosine biosynthesis protein TsaB